MQVAYAFAKWLLAGVVTASIASCGEAVVADAGLGANPSVGLEVRHARPAYTILIFIVIGWELMNRMPQFSMLEAVGASAQRSGEECVVKRDGIRKISVMLVALVVVVSLAGCGGKKSSKAKEAANTQTEQTAQEQPASKQQPANEQPAQPQPQSQPAPQEQPAADAAVADAAAAVDETLIRPEFKEAMDSYEAFFDEYIDFMNRYKANPTNAELLMQSADMLTKEAKMLKEFDEWEKADDMTTAETAYYLEVHARIYQKLATVA